jgi:hypothetical protein
MTGWPLLRRHASCRAVSEAQCQERRFCILIVDQMRGQNGLQSSLQWRHWHDEGELPQHQPNLTPLSSPSLASSSRTKPQMKELSVEDRGKQCRIQKKITSGYRSNKSFTPVESDQFRICPHSGCVPVRRSLVHEQFALRSCSNIFLAFSKQSPKT